jgi:hypothetical protein
MPVSFSDLQLAFEPLLVGDNSHRSRVHMTNS